MAAPPCPIHAADKAGNVATVKRKLIVDTLPPVLTVTAVGTATTNDPQVRVYTADPVSTPRLKVTVDGKPSPPGASAGRVRSAWAR